MSATPVNVSAGALTGNTSTVTLQSYGGFTGSVSLTASIVQFNGTTAVASNPPAFTFAPSAPVAVASDGSLAAMLQVSTTGSSAGTARKLPSRSPFPNPSGGVALGSLLLFGIRRRGTARNIVAAGLLLLVTMIATGCSSSTSAPVLPATTPGSYLVKITGSAASASANFVPSDAVNELEMWQSSTFDPAEIDREVGWAQGIGMNTMRVFLHNMLWEQDPRGFTQRIDQYLAIARKHHIRTVFVLFDSCWDPDPRLGPQPAPIPGVHNSRWVQAPGRRELADPADYPRLRDYVQGVVGHFSNDPRVLAWDVWNEPENRSPLAAGMPELPNKKELVLHLLPQVFAWAREENPTQPLTSGIYEGDWSSAVNMNPIQQVQIEESDIISFHNYGWPEVFEARIRELRQFPRPILCTEYMAQGRRQHLRRITSDREELSCRSHQLGR